MWDMKYINYMIHKLQSQNKAFYFSYPYTLLM